MTRLAALFLACLSIMAAGRIAQAGPVNEEASAMIASRLEIAALVNDWAFHRDQESWDALRETFHADGTISLSWFDGPHEAFVAASRNLAKAGNARLKHQIGVPRIRIEGGRALSEVNVTIMVRTKMPAAELDTTSWARFYDRLEKRDGAWKIVQRTAIYEKDRADPVTGPALPAALYEGLEKYPAELRFLAASLDKAGIPLSKSTVLDKSPELKALYAAGDAWLAGD